MAGFYLAAVIPGLLLTFGIEGFIVAFTASYTWAGEAFEAHPVAAALLAASMGPFLTLAFCVSTYRNLKTYSIACPLLSVTHAGEGAEEVSDLQVNGYEMTEPEEKILETVILASKAALLDFQADRLRLVADGEKPSESPFDSDELRRTLSFLTLPGGGKWGYRFRYGVFGRSPIEWERIWDLEGIVNTLETGPVGAGEFLLQDRRGVLELISPAFEDGWGEMEIRYLLVPGPDQSIEVYRHDRDFQGMGRFLALRDPKFEKMAIEPSGKVQSWAPWGDPLTGLGWNAGPLPYSILRGTPMGRAFTGTYNRIMADSAKMRKSVGYRRTAMRAWAAVLVFGPPVTFVTSLSLFGASRVPFFGSSTTSYLFTASIAAAIAGAAAILLICGISRSFAGRASNPP